MPAIPFGLRPTMRPLFERAEGRVDLFIPLTLLFCAGWSQNTEMVGVREGLLAMSY